MKITKFRTEIQLHNQLHPNLPNCIYQNCPNKIKPAWDNEVLCHEHELIMLHWFYEKDGAKYCPDIWNVNGSKLPKPKGSDKDMTAYRKHYCDWIASLTPIEYEQILKNQIGDND